MIRIGDAYNATSSTEVGSTMNAKADSSEIENRALVVVPRKTDGAPEEDPKIGVVSEDACREAT